MDKFDKIIKATVEGQIKGFIKEHPSILKGVDWYKPRSDKTTTLINSLSKRIVRDLTCSSTRARLEEALLGTLTEDAPNFTSGRITGRENQSVWNRLLSRLVSPLIERH
jgi:hypothetical protein